MISSAVPILSSVSRATLTSRAEPHLLQNLLTGELLNWHLWQIWISPFRPFFSILRFHPARRGILSSFASSRRVRQIFSLFRKFPGSTRYRLAASFS